MAEVLGTSLCYTWGKNSLGAPGTNLLLYAVGNTQGTVVSPLPGEGEGPPVGSSQSNEGKSDGWVTQINPSQLSVKMTTQVGGTENDYLSSCTVEIDSDGNAQVFTLGTTQGQVYGNNNFGGSDLFLTKYEEDLRYEYVKQVSWMHRRAVLILLFVGSSLPTMTLFTNDVNITSHVTRSACCSSGRLKTTFHRYPVPPSRGGESGPSPRRSVST